MQLKNYQETAIKELLEKAKKLLGYPDSKKLVFKAPTGSGKTIMMAEFLKQLVENHEIKQALSFIWTAPRHLHEQSRSKLEKYFEDSRALKCSFFEDLDDRKIGENEILFFNWESINKTDAIYIRDNEQENNLSNILARTKEESREIILVIDESHHHATSDISKKLIEDINPKLTIEVSATPVVENPDDLVNVQLEDVKKEGMIKKGVILNEDFKNILKSGKIKTELSSGSEDLVIKQALKKREEILEAYKKEKTDINPLVLVQLPDRIGSLEDEMRIRVERILKDKYKISTENGKLAIWLSGEHVNKENVEKHNSDVEVLIFKQAIALGWDCPRAQILVLFREWHSQIFSIQTVGRIMRMPEPDKGHYKNEILNYSYVYTNLDDIEIKEDIAKDYISVFTSKRRNDYKPVNLLSYHSKRQREKTRLAPLFIGIFLDEAKKYKLKEKIKIKSNKVDIKLISDFKAYNVDAMIGTHIAGDKSFDISGIELQKIFDYFARQNLTPFYPEDRSVGRVRDSIYRYFEEEYKMDYGECQDEIIRVVLSEKNKQYFINVLDVAKAKYKEAVEKREAELESEKNWNIPEKISFGSNVKEESRKKSIMEPFYTIDKWKNEKAFIEYLENSDKIDWWFKNGDRDATFFAVPYQDGDIQKPFYVDFIIKFKDGKIGLFDTKGELTLKSGKTKIDGLYKYIQSENKKSKKLFGGVVANTDSRNYRGRWVYFGTESKNLKDNNFDNWETLEF
ncbi:MAG: DEAD/DEAH box helicase family protein [Elusimicrobiota bacterium]|nr:DEAD/DEAH box helicase family protein [Elusimicrobiota bacterium]